MKKYPRLVSSDSKGQLVIPKEVRNELSIGEGTAFWAFLVENEGILLKRISGEELGYHDHMVLGIKQKSEKIGVDKTNLDRTIEKYRKKGRTTMEEI